MKRRNFIGAAIGAALAGGLAIGTGGSALAAPASFGTQSLASKVEAVKKQHYFVSVRELSSQRVMDEVFAVGNSKSEFDLDGKIYRIEFIPALWNNSVPALHMVISTQQRGQWYVADQTYLALDSEVTVYTNVEAGLVLSVSPETAR